MKNEQFCSQRDRLGTYDVLAIVDQTHLPGVIKDQSTGVTLGWCVTTRASVRHHPTVGQSQDT
jgi:hypothetical protein